MNDMRLIPVTDPSQIPANMSEKAAREFWDTHEITEELLATERIVDEDEPLPVQLRDGGMLIRLSHETSRRLRALAERRQTRPKALLETLLDERLAEEERRGA